MNGSESEKSVDAPSEQGLPENNATEETPMEKPSDEKPIETSTSGKPIEPPTEEKEVADKPKEEKLPGKNWEQTSETTVPSLRQTGSEKVHSIDEEKPAVDESEQKPVEEKPAVKPEAKTSTETSPVSVPQQPDSDTHDPKEKITNDVANKPKTVITEGNEPKTEVTNVSKDNKKGRKMEASTDQTPPIGE